MKYEKLFIPVLFILLFTFVMIAPFTDTFTKNGDLYINEVMSSNKKTIQASNGKYYDYIEIYNGYDYDINLEGYFLTDDNSNTKKFCFPKVIIPAKDYLLVYASGLNVVNSEEIHTNFKIDSKGEIIMLFEPDGDIVSKISVNSMLEDTSYGYNGERYVYYYNPTPGKENSKDYSKTPITRLDSSIDLSINEYITNNVSSVKASDNKYYSMVELYNKGKTNINLEGFSLTNGEYSYIFPNIEIKSNDYLVLYLSGLAKIENNEVHTNFILDNKSEVLTILDNNKQIVNKVNLQKLEKNITCGKYNNEWHLYSNSSFGTKNSDNYIKDDDKKEIIISEVSAVNAFIEIKNISNKTINLSNYSLSDKSGKVYNLGNISLTSNNYLSISENKLGFSIGTIDEIIYLLKDNVVIDTLNIDKLRGGISTGITNNQKVYYKNITSGKENSNIYYLGYAKEPVFSIDGGYIESGQEITLTTSDESSIYYTLDGSFPTNKSTLYTKPIKINKNTVVKAISYKDSYIESDVISRTFIVGRKHDISFISISSDYNNLFGSTGLITNYTSNALKKISFEFYEDDGSYGTSFTGEAKLSGNLGGSRDKAQKAMTVYLRKTYGNNTVIYPFFKDNDNLYYSSILLRNGGEDYLNIHIFDAALQVALKGQMDLDMQDYRPVVVYLNGTYYGIYNMRDKLNSDYVSNIYDVSKDEMSVIKYSTATKGTTKEYKDLVNYIKSHNTKDKSVYEYLKTQIDMQELCNYWITQSYYGNTDLGNIKYFKTENGKWRFMLYDIDWSLYYTARSFTYPVLNTNIPAVTYVYSTIDITRRLYQNSEFKELYLTTLAYHLKNTFKPERMNKIIDDLSKEIENEVVYHNQKWAGTNSSMESLNTWKNNLKRFKDKLSARYNYVVKNLKASFNLSNEEYNKYFGDL